MQRPENEDENIFKLTIFVKNRFMKLYLYRFLALVMFLSITSTAFSQDVITTYAGMVGSFLYRYTGDGGPATAALMDNPSDITIDKYGNLFIADFQNNVIRKVDTFGIITTIAGTGYGAGSAGSGAYSGDDGPATDAKLNGPYAMAFDPSGNLIFADGYNHIVRKISTTGYITRFAGNGIASYGGDGGPATDAKLNNPVGIAIDKVGNVYIADDHNNVIRKVDTAGVITTVAGNTTAGYTGDGGLATAAELNLPIGLAIDSAGNLFVAEENNSTIRKVNKAGIISTYVGTGTKGHTGDGGPSTAARIDSAQRIVFDDSDNLYISDGRNNVVRKVNTAGIISTVAGNGFAADSTICFFDGEDSVALKAVMCTVQGVAFDQYHRMYICDRGNDVIRRVGPPVAIVVDHTGVKNLTGSPSTVLSVYPNPARSGIFMATLTSATNEEAKVVVTNMLGQSVYSATSTTNKQLIISLHEPPGIYLLTVTSANGKWNKQVTIDK
jgi:type IX secretion system substrate protein